MTDPVRRGKAFDLSRRPVSFMIGWGVPIIVLLSVNILEAYWPPAPIILMMGGAFIWMGAGCVINALRCGRIHCYLSGPAMLLGGTLIILIGFDILDLGAVRVMHISYATLLAVALSFVPEAFTGSYGRKTRRSSTEEERR